MLRGQASLQEIVGKGPSFKRKPPAKSTKDKKRQKTALKGNTRPIVRPGNTGAAASHSGDDQQGGVGAPDGAPPAAAPPGTVVCPVCSKAVSEAGTNFDSHLGK